MDKYKFPGPGPFAKKAAHGVGKGHMAGDVETDPTVQTVAGLIGQIESAKDPKDKDAARREVQDALDRHEVVSRAVKAMVDEAFPPLGLSRPRTASSRRVSGAAEPSYVDASAADPYAHEQPTDDEGNPLTLDPENPEHAGYIESAPKYDRDSAPSEILGMRMAGDWPERSARASQLAAQGITDRDLIQGNPYRGDSAERISADQIDKEFDQYMKSGAADRESREAARLARLRATGADVGMTGNPPRPNTGINQDFGQADVPTQFDKPPQSDDPYQTANPPYRDQTHTDHGQAVNRPQGPVQGTGLTREGVDAARRQAGDPGKRDAPRGQAAQGRAQQQQQQQGKQAGQQQQGQDKEGK